MNCYRNRTIKNIEGQINLMSCYLGVNNMTKVKMILGIVRRPLYKIRAILKLKKWCNSAKQDLDISFWEKNFYTLLWNSNDKLHLDMVEEFFCYPPRLEKDFEVPIESGVIVVTVVHNELCRMTKFIEHYRSIGVKNFLIIDNNSTDGTKEFLMLQKDVRLFCSERRFSPQRQIGWCNYAMATVGTMRWYLFADCDEFANYIGMSKGDSIAKYVDRVYNNGTKAIKAIMLDMYPQTRLDDTSMVAKNFREDFVFHDPQEVYSFDEDLRVVSGGYIERLLGKSRPTRTKTPLFFLDKGRFLVGCHHIFPLSDDIVSPFGIVFQHYKFIPGDQKKIEQYAISGVHANNSSLYKKYLSLYDGTNESTLYYEKSAKWEGEKTVSLFLGQVNR